MKTIVVEGKTDCEVLKVLFPYMTDKGVTLRVAQGFSNVFAASKTLVDYGFEVLAVLDTDTRMPGTDNREIMKRIQSSGVAARKINIVWMDSCIEDVLQKANPSIFQDRSGGVNLRQSVDRNKAAILALEEFRTIQEFIEK